MGWPTTATVCAAEGHRDGRQRGFTAGEVQQLAGIFGISSWQLTTRYAKLRRAPAGWVRLPDMRSPSLDMKPPSAGLAEKTAGRNRCWLKCSW